MSLRNAAIAVGCLAGIAHVAAHGVVTGIVADGVYYRGYHLEDQYLAAGTAPINVGWSDPKDQSLGFIAPDAYATSDIICHLGATNAGTSAPVKAGGTVELQWTVWPSSHHGPVIDYLASCGGDCTTVDKTTLKFFKIAEAGLIDDSVTPGTWASDQLIAANNSHTVTIPADIAAGGYVLRHEIIALHSAGTADGAQNYPQCVSIEVTGGGSATPSTSGTLGTALYSETDPGILVNIYATLSNYTIPGPALYAGAAAQGSVSSSVAPAATTAVEASSIASIAPVAVTSSVEPVAATTSAEPSIVATSAEPSTVPSSVEASGGPDSVSSTFATSTSPTIALTSSAASITSAILSTSTAPNGQLFTVTSIITVEIYSTIYATASESYIHEPSSKHISNPSNSITRSTTAKSPKKAKSTSKATSKTKATVTAPVETAATAASIVSVASASSSSVTSTSTTATTMPAGTTFETLLDWMQSMITSILGGDTSLITKREHSRAVVAAVPAGFRGN